MKKRLFVFLSICLFIVSCGGSGSSSSSGTGADSLVGANPTENNAGDPGVIAGSGMGTLRVSITDAPNQEFKEINVTISGVMIHTSADAGSAEAGWHELKLDSPVRINLLSLQNGVLRELGLIPLEAGHYQQIRLLVVPNSGGDAPFNNSVVFASGASDVEMPLEIPTENTTGIKLVHQFRVDEGKTADLILDLDGKKSVIAQGNGIYKLKPVIKAIVMGQDA